MTRLRNALTGAGTSVAVSMFSVVERQVPSPSMGDGDAVLSDLGSQPSAIWRLDTPRSFPLKAKI